VTAVCAYCYAEDRRLTILDGTPIEQALMDLEDDDLSHGGCKPHIAREWEKVRALPDRRIKRDEG
jgi:hypothetical protein